MEANLSSFLDQSNPASSRLNDQHAFEGQVKAIHKEQLDKIEIIPRNFSHKIYLNCNKD